MVRRPDRAFGDADPVEWHYASRPDLEAALAEHAAFVAELERAGADVLYHDEPLARHADAIFVHDPVLVADRGAILLRPGKLLRRGEEEALGRALEKAGVPIHYRLSGDASAESGDLLWLDHRTLLAGLGFRTNRRGIEQLREALGPEVEVVPVELPYAGGPAACLHLMSFLSLVDTDLAVVYLPPMPVELWRRLRDRGIELVEVPDAEYPTMGPNVLALGPRHCLMLEGNPVTRDRLERAGCRVVTYRGREISLTAEGGATCLTRPVLRR
jgi:N-dimethylarginine dimethylaminohydrolase